MNLRRQLVLVSLVALALPWAGCQYLRQVDRALAQGQMQALEATASAVAARLASAPRLIAPDPARHARPPGAQLYLNPLPQAPRLDGYGGEWRRWGFPPRALLDADGEPLARATLGRRNGQVYLLLTVADRSPAYHDPRTQLAASGDAVRIITARRRYTLPVASQGNARALWHNAARGKLERELRLRGRWTSSTWGYRLELTLPYALTEGELAIQVLDRTASDGGSPRRSAGTLPADGLPGRLVQPLARLQAELDHFARPQLRLAVVDAEGFLLANSGRIESGQNTSQEFWLRRWIYRRLLARNQLPAMPDKRLPPTLTAPAARRDTAQQWFRAPLGGRIGAASVPVITRADDIVERPLLGRVIVLQSGAALQSLTESAAHRLWLVSCAAAGTALLLLLGYASWLSWRIRRLHRAARNALDERGRLRGGFPQSRSNDELGALNRAFASLLAELDQYHQYLRTLASKLSHELRTPLAVVRSSLDNLAAGALDNLAAGALDNLAAGALDNLAAGAQDNPAAGALDNPAAGELDDHNRRYLERAMDGGARLSGILNSLSAASHLEASIHQSEKEDFDLADLLEVLVQSYDDAQPQHRFALHKPDGTLAARGAPELLAQLLDKLVDNACSFAPEGSEIRLEVQRYKGGYQVSVENDGPPLPQGYDHKLFDSLVSVRDDGGRAGHLGLGLHIARLIADFHGGRLAAANRADGSGVIFTLSLPN